MQYKGTLEVEIVSWKEKSNEWLITTSMHELPQMSYFPKSQWHLYTWKIVRALIHSPSDFIVDTPLDIKTLPASRPCLASSHLSSFGGVGDGAQGRESEVSVGEMKGLEMGWMLDQHRRWVNRHGDAVQGYTSNGNSQLEREDNEWLITMSMHESPWMSYSPKSQWHIYMWKIVRALMYVEVQWFEAALAIRIHCKHFVTVGRSCLASSCLSSFGKVEVPWVVYGNLMAWGCTCHQTLLQPQVRCQVSDGQQVILSIIVPVIIWWGLHSMGCM